MIQGEALVTVLEVREGSVMRLMLAGRLNLETAAVLKAAVRRVIARGCCNILLDMQGVEFINSSGLGALVSVLKDVRIAGGRLALCHLARYVKEIFEVTQLANVFVLYATDRDALVMLREGARVDTQPAPKTEPNREGMP